MSALGGQWRQSRFKVDIRKDSMVKVGLELGLRNMREEVVPKPERNRKAPVRHREQRRRCVSRDGF